MGTTTDLSTFLKMPDVQAALSECLVQEAAQ